MMFRLFVYGSLKRGFRHHGELEGADFETEAATEDGYALVLADGYPALMRGAGRVFGEVVRVTPEQLERLDSFEAVPALYERATIRLSDGSTAYTYVLPSARGRDFPLLAGGRYLER